MNMADDMADSMYDDHQSGKREEALYTRSKLLELSDQDFLEVLLMNPVNIYEHPRISLNSVIPDFPAGNIAVKHRDNKLALTDKQKMALANVYVYMHLKIRLSGHKK